MGLEEFTTEALRAEIRRRQDEAYRKERERQAGLVCGKCGSPYPSYDEASVHKSNATKAAQWMYGFSTNSGYLAASEYEDSVREGRYCAKCNAEALHLYENYVSAFHQLGHGDMRSTWKGKAHA